MSSDALAPPDPPGVRQVKALLGALAAVFFGWWLQYIKFRWPRTQPFVNAVPNAMSVARLIASPISAVYLGMAIWRGQTSTAWWWLAAVIGLIVLDGIDGPLARDLDAVTDIGKALDPLADKVAMFSLAIVYSVLAYHFQGWAVFIPLAGVLGWVFWVEIKLIRITPYTDQLGKLLGDVELRGANNFGKIKFTIQAVSFLLAFIWMIARPTAIEGGVWLITMMIVARWFADKSLGGHREDVRQLQKQVLRRGLPLPEPQSILQMVRSHLHSGAGDNTESGQSAA